jgi:hypothetical protein
MTRATVAGAIPISACVSGTRAPGLMTFSEYRQRRHDVPIVLRVQANAGKLLYIGTAHTNDPADP